MKSEFWLDLSSEKKRINPLCERCGSDEELQAHHRVYRPRWGNTVLEDLETLCRSCHRKEHGLKKMFCGRVLIYRDDVRFSRILYWTHYLNTRMFRTAVGLKDSEKRYLEIALKLYPPTEKDSCMKFHIEQTLKTSTIAHTLK